VKVTYRWDAKDYGIDNLSIIEGRPEPHISCYAFPNVNRFSGGAEEEGGPLVRNLIYRVPLDDHSTLLYNVRFYPSDKRTFTTKIRENKLGEYARLESDWWGINFIDQDRMAAEQQGFIADRPNEHLGTSDLGIIQMRQMMRKSLKLVAEGKDPLCLIRDPVKQNIEFAQQPTLAGAKPEDAKVIYNPAFYTTPQAKRLDA
jgi:Rieske oxygenase family protein